MGNLFGSVTLPGMTIPAITVICYLGGEICKAVGLKKKWLPVFCGLLGGVLGVLTFYLSAPFPETDLITAAAHGIISGLAATGANQMAKQFGRND